MFSGKIVGFNYFNQTFEGKPDLSKVRVSFEDLDSPAQEGKHYRSFNFRADRVPKLDDKLIGKTALYDVGNYNGSFFGKDLRII